MLHLDGQVHHDTHAVPMGNYVIGVGNYVIATPSDLGNYKIADMVPCGRRLRVRDANAGCSYPAWRAVMGLVLPGWNAPRTVAGSSVTLGGH